MPSIEECRGFASAQRREAMQSDSAQRRKHLLASAARWEALADDKAMAKSAALGSPNIERS